MQIIYFIVNFMSESFAQPYGLVITKGYTNSDHLLILNLKSNPWRVLWIQIYLKNIK